jgi:hypothetical protein
VAVHLIVHRRPTCAVVGQPLSAAGLAKLSTILSFFYSLEWAEYCTKAWSELVKGQYFSLFHLALQEEPVSSNFGPHRDSPQNPVVEHYIFSLFCKNKWRKRKKK